MGLIGFVKDKIFLRIINNFLEAHMAFLGKFFAWFNAVPGRKRGAGAVILAVAAGLSGFGYEPWADATKQLVPFLDLLVPGANIVGIATAVIGIVHAFFRKDPVS